MKRFFIVAILMSALVNITFAQDLIVTAKGDSINCKITKEKGNFIYFRFMKGQDVRETLADKSKITYVKGYYSQPELPANYTRTIMGDFDRLRISVNGGYSYRFAKISSSVPDAFRDYMKELKSGSHFSIDGTYFISNSLGFGLKYSQFHSKNNFGQVSIDYNGDGITDYGTMKDDMTISFFGPMVSTMVPSANKKNALVSSFSMGYLGYKDEGALIIPLTLKGGSLGLVGDIGYQFGIAKNLSLAITASYTLGQLSKIKQTIDGSTDTIDLDDDQHENLGRFDLSVGLVFHR